MTTVAQGPVGTQKKIGVRERSKQERQDRITLAARKLFAEQGYDVTTLRQVAECAGLGLGTLFNYISDKRDLIYLVFNQEVNTATDAAVAAPRSWQTFSEKILGMIEPNYRLFGSEPVLSRILLSEVLQLTPGFHLAEHVGIRDRFIRGMQEVIAGAQATGEIGSQESPELIARHIFFVYSSALRWWLATSEYPDWRMGMRDLAQVLTLQTAGLAVRQETRLRAVNGGGVALSASSGNGPGARTGRKASAYEHVPTTKRARPIRKA